MLYWLLFSILLIFTLIEIKEKKISSKIFKYSWIVLVLMVTLRQGQGTDYYNYLEIYKEVTLYSSQSFWLLFVQSDPGFRIICFFAIALGIPYEMFASLFSLWTMILIYPFFRIHCRKSVIALFIFYASSFYLIYMFSAIRQGFVIAVFLGKLYPLLLQNKRKSYYLLTILLSSIHLSSLVLLIVPYVYSRRIGRNALLLFSSIGVIFMFVNPFEIVLSNLGFNRLDRYIVDEISSTKYLAILLRIIILIPLFLLPKSIYRKYKELNIMRNFLFISFMIYAIFSFSELTASRLGIYFKVFEGCFLALIIHQTYLKKISYQICYCYILLTFLLFAKDINAFIDQGNYKNCTMWTYPYLSIFDNENTILNYRSFIQ